jgi:hypothetical protein
MKRVCNKCNNDIRNNNKSGYCQHCLRKNGGPRKGVMVSAQTRKKMSESAMNRGPHSKEIYQKIGKKLKGKTGWSKGLTKENHPGLKKMAVAQTKRFKDNPDLGFEHSKRLIRLISENKFNNKHHFKRGWYTSSKTKEENHYDSSYELRRMIELDEDESVLKWTKNHKIVIEYICLDGKRRNYLPDFLILYMNGNQILEEVKGWKSYNFEEKVIAANVYCNENRMKYEVNFMSKVKEY